jgi:hypothetical protein
VHLMNSSFGGLTSKKDRKELDESEHFPGRLRAQEGAERVWWIDAGKMSKVSMAGRGGHRVGYNYPGLPGSPQPKNAILEYQTAKFPETNLIFSSL